MKEVKKNTTKASTSRMEFEVIRVCMSVSADRKEAARLVGCMNSGLES